MSLLLNELSFSYGKTEILKQITLGFQPQVNIIIGPNGAGKSTLIKCMAGLLTAKGQITYKEKTIGKNYDEYYSTIMSYLPQYSGNTASLTVFETVLLGRLNTLSLKIDNATLNKVNRLLSELEISEIAKKQLNELSGGQQQMVYIAQAIIKDPSVILLDEPLNSLDIHHQFEILDIIKALSIENQTITVIALHDLNLAAKYADHIVVMHQGAIHSQGKPAEVLTVEMIRDVYQVEAKIVIDSDGIPLINPIRCLSSRYRCKV